MASQPASAMQQPAGRGLHTEGSELRSYSYSYSDASAAALPFAQLLANAASGGSDWKVLLFFPHMSIPGRICHIPVRCYAHDQASILPKALTNPMQLHSSRGLQKEWRYYCVPVPEVSHCCVRLRCRCLGCRSG